MVPSAREPETPRGELHVTTCRFDADLWHDFGVEAQRLGVPRSAYIRDAVREKVAGSHYRGALAQFAGRLERLERIERERRP